MDASSHGVAGVGGGAGGNGGDGGDGGEMQMAQSRQWKLLPHKEGLHHPAHMQCTVGMINSSSKDTMNYAWLCGKLETVQPRR